MLVERSCRYFNKGLTIMCNERETIRVALECLPLFLYAWNSCLVPGADISRSLVAVGHRFAFPIDYSSGKHWQLTSSPATVESYGHLPTLAVLTPALIYPVILSLLAVPPVQLLAGAMSESLNTNSPGHGRSLNL
jgi:hypothetical protein